MAKVLVASQLPEEKIKNVRFLYIVIDSDLQLHYEFNNQGHVILPIHWSELNPRRIYRNLPRNLIRKCVAEKEDIIGVLQVWVYYKRTYSYARIKALGVLESFKGNKMGALFSLLKAMDRFCTRYNLRFVEAETNVIPEGMMKRLGFVPASGSSWWRRMEHFITRQRAYVKHYPLLRRA